MKQSFIAYMSEYMKIILSLLNHEHQDIWLFIIFFYLYIYICDDFLRRQSSLANKKCTKRTRGVVPA